MNRHRIADLLVLVALTVLVILYGIDSIRASTETLNLIFVLPVTVIVLILCAVSFIMQVPRIHADTTGREPVGNVFPVMALFTVYVVTLPWLGFDVGTLAFVLAFLWLHGERRWPWLIGYALSFAGFMALFFSKMLPYPMPMLLLDAIG